MNNMINTTSVWMGAGSWLWTGIGMLVMVILMTVVVKQIKK